MKLEKIKFDKAINPSYFKKNLMVDKIELFKTNFKELFNRINETESEEHNKNIVSDFLKNTFYKNTNEINTAERKDLVIHKGNTSNTPVAIIIEAKSPTNKNEMISFDKPNAKALHETIHYFLQERIIKQNKEIKHIIITNIFDWYIFDVQDFEKYFYTNKTFRNQYLEWNDKKLLGNTTDWYYNEIAKPYIEKEIESLNSVYFNLLEYKEIVNNKNIDDDKKLINLYKIFSPEHLLKLSFSNDYNKIDLGFYNELLYILGLEEVKEGGKKTIIRSKEKNRKEGSLIENTINLIETKNQRANDETNNAENNFETALELCITWLNRILFLKLLEAQLVKYHKNDNNYQFLNSQKINDFSELDELFFEVMAIPFDKRNEAVTKKFGTIPYLNSSLFDPTDFEKKYIYISLLKKRLSLPIFSNSILKQSHKYKNTSELNTLEYLFEFLNAYNFSSDQKAEIQNDNKTIINAAVLGLIFEKINGYKDGSFYTPSYITTFISRELLKSTIIQKFSKALNIKIDNFHQLKDLIDFAKPAERQKANDLINSIKICDPAVGSGHFLVSVLNEIIALKSELKILQYQNGTRIKGIIINNINDELEIIDEETSEPFQYYVNDKHLPLKEIQALQEALFNEKRILIEKCIFGVDINPKSVLICRLRLWIELLKNSYYTQDSNFKYLETLPNIDFNIVAGNSLISKFDNGLDIFEKQAVKDLIYIYKTNANVYKNETDYVSKINCKRTIENVKQDLLKFAKPQDKHYKAYLTKSRELGNLIELKSQLEPLRKQIIKLSAEVVEHEKKYQENYQNVYKNSLEWAMEFPEILNDDGDFVGFDMIIGNPPYFTISNEPKLKEVNENYSIYKQSADIYTLFIERGLQILQPEGKLSFIISNKWLRAAYGENLREFLLKNTTINKLIDFDGLKVFDEATVDTSIIELTKHKNGKQTVEAVRFDKTFDLEKDSILDYYNQHKIELIDLNKESWNFASEKEKALKVKMYKVSTLLENWPIKINYGIKTGFNKAFFIDEETKNNLIEKDNKNKQIISPLLRGRDVHNYFIDKKERYLINTYNGKLITEYNPNTEKNIRVRKNRIDVENDYPIIYNYLKEFELELKKREDQGEHWTNHRNCAYQHLFYQEKIIYPETTGRRSEFYLDTENYIIDKTCFMITGNNLKYILAVLNSRLIEFYFENEGRLIGQSAIQYSKQYVEKIPIPEITNNNKAEVEKIELLVNEILAKKKIDVNCDISEETKEIDQLIYKIYQLTEQEIGLIEK
jgi:adenine-specific DNA-methyltransferase